MYNFKIKSIIHDYEVQFVDELATALNAELVESDFILIDYNITEMYSGDFGSLLKKHRHLCLDATESQKSYQGIIPIIQTLINRGFRKNHRLIAIGGGITQDITAFIASIMYRGVNWLFFPTTLLAQGDSCIGSKTSINFGEFKNQVGGFYPPNKILIYPHFIDTLSESEMKSGMGEMLHYFVVSSSSDFQMYADNYKAAFHDKQKLSAIIARSLEIKKGYIEKDEFDQNIRQVFNYGHSFGHAIESLTHYKIPHGIAVSFGMDMANYVSVKMGLIPETIRAEIRQITEYIWEGYSIDGIDVPVFIKALGTDKKNVGSQLGLILNRGYGKIYKQLLEADERFISWIEQYFKEELSVKSNI
ncbi:MAG: 3-dehydroquinate synthase [Bacteroidetes bacterium]|nr:3-dehydroquinate synthase [Bacteroidota bacterium]